MAKLFDELKALKEAYDKKLNEEGENAIKELFKELFEKHPQLESVSWRQYTPYFNDGDPCYFRVGEFEPEFDGDEDEASNDAVYELADELPEEVLESVFGDHVKITATRDGFEVTEYEHD